MQKTQAYYENKIITIPNLMSISRILIIPVMIYAYVVKKEYMLTLGLFILSGLTDIFDGYIARRFNMISKFGKGIDPLADKLTQVSMLYCLSSRFPFMIVPFIFMFVKEFITSCLRALAIRKTGKVESAYWHGKVNTCFLFAMMFLHLVWVEIPLVISNVTIVLCLCTMTISFVLYNIDSIKKIRS